MIDNKNIVILAGSGRSGTTWLGSILDSCKGVEYFYEINKFPELDFDSPGLLREKYPIIYWFSKRPVWLRKFEQAALKVGMQIPGFTRASRAIKINRPPFFSKGKIKVHAFKIVNLLDFSLRISTLTGTFSNRLKIVHIIRNPFSQLASEIRQHQANPEHAKKHFNDRINYVLHESRLKKY